MYGSEIEDTLSDLDEKSDNLVQARNWLEEIPESLMGTDIEDNISRLFRDEQVDLEDILSNAKDAVDELVNKIDEIESRLSNISF